MFMLNQRSKLAQQKELDEGDTGKEIRSMLPVRTVEEMNNLNKLLTKDKRLGKEFVSHIIDYIKLN